MQQKGGYARNPNARIFQAAFNLNCIPNLMKPPKTSNYEVENDSRNLLYDFSKAISTKLQRYEIDWFNVECVDHKKHVFEFDLYKKFKNISSCHKTQKNVEEFILIGINFYTKIENVSISSLKIKIICVNLSNHLKIQPIQLSNYCLIEII